MPPKVRIICFCNNFLLHTKNAFPKVKIKIKIKNLLSPWISKGILKSSKKKQKLYDKYLKNRTYKNEKNYKTYKNMFETVKDSVRTTNTCYVFRK